MLPGAREIGELLFNGYNIPVWVNEGILEMGSDDICTALWID